MGTENQEYFIYILKLTAKYTNQSNWGDEVKEILDQHEKYLFDLADKQIMKMVGRTNFEIDSPYNFGIALFKADGKEQADRIMNEDPGIKNGIMHGMLYPFNLAIG